jgi:glycosyltransferase involved in cell wall biosynthesis
MRIHAIALPHLDLTREHAFCAYSQKARRWSLMLAPHGHEVYQYASEWTDDDTRAACVEYVPIVGPSQRQRWFGGPWPESQVFDRWDANDPCWREMNDAAIVAIRERIQPGDAIAIIAGWCQKQIGDAFPDHPLLEPFVGYPGILPNSYRVFESNAWRSFCTAQAATDDVRYFDAVIGNCYGLDECAAPREHDGYLLFLGRPTERKGLAVVRELAARYPLKCAGQSDPQIPGAEYVGLVHGDDKAKLLAAAAAVLAPTVYHGPFEGVAVEGQMSGAPAITTDHGVFPETVQEGDGWRCNTLAEFCAAAEAAFATGLYQRRDIARRARARWSLEAGGVLYDRWLRRIELLQREGWYADAPPPAAMMVP